MEKYPPIANGTTVVTTQANESLRSEWTDEGWASRKWGVLGIVKNHHDSHGLSYEVKHQDGTIGHYDPSEIEVSKCLQIRDNIYVGKPLKLSIFDGVHWRGASNFLSVNDDDLEVSLNDLAHCWECMKTGSNRGGLYGYILDMEKKTVYYDDQRALDHLQQTVFPKWNLIGYFESFIQKSFR